MAPPGSSLLSPLWIAAVRCSVLRVAWLPPRRPWLSARRGSKLGCFPQALAIPNTRIAPGDAGHATPILSVPTPRVLLGLPRLRLVRSRSFGLLRFRAYGLRDSGLAVPHGLGRSERRRDPGRGRRLPEPSGSG